MDIGSRDFSLGSQARENFVLRDGMLPDSDAARVINGICQGAGSSADGRFRETFGPKEPTRLEAINQYVGLFWWFHDCRNPVRHK